MNSINKRYPLAEPFKTESNIEQMCFFFYWYDGCFIFKSGGWYYRLLRVSFWLLKEFCCWSACGCIVVLLRPVESRIVYSKTVYNVQIYIFVLSSSTPSYSNRLFIFLSTMLLVRYFDMRWFLSKQGSIFNHRVLTEFSHT